MAIFALIIYNIRVKLVEKNEFKKNCEFWSEDIGLKRFFSPDGARALSPMDGAGQVANSLAGIGHITSPLN